MFKHLSNGKVNVGLVQELALNELIYVLEKCEGPKVINNEIFKKKLHPFVFFFSF